MTALWTPMHWPAGWTETSTLDLLKGSAVDYWLVDQGATFDPIRAQVQQAGLRIGPPCEAPAGVTLLSGQWPGVKTARSDATGVTIPDLKFDYACIRKLRRSLPVQRLAYGGN